MPIIKSFRVVLIELAAALGQGHIWPYHRSSALTL